MNKVKVRCSVCGKSFKSPTLKKTVCPSCEEAAKRARHQPLSNKPAAPVVTQATAVDVRAALRAAQENQGQFAAYRPPAPAPVPPPPQLEPQRGHVVRGPAQGHGPVSHGGRHDAHGGPRMPKSAEAGQPRPPRPPREPKPRVVTKPFEPTDDQIAAIRDRYVQLAQPEFDGIRHQIATELGVPLRAVKDVIKKTRDELQIQSWWDRGGGLPTPEDVARIKELYLPQLPEPEVGVHKRIAAELHLTNTSVYQAIGQIREELDLPRYVPREASADSETPLSDGKPESPEPQPEPALPHLAAAE